MHDFESCAFNQALPPLRGERGESLPVPRRAVKGANEFFRGVRPKCERTRRGHHSSRASARCAESRSTVPEVSHAHTPPTATAGASTPRTAPSIHINLPRVRMSATLHSRQVRFSFPVIVSIKPSSSIPREGRNSLRPHHARHRSSCGSASCPVCSDSTYHWTKSRSVQVCGMSVFPCAAR